MIRILGKASSINVRKVLWACEEIGIDYAREDWGLGFRETTVPEFLRLNPNGLVPVVEIDGLVLWESNTILRYLAATSGRDDLLPVEAAGRAHVEKWMDWQASDFNSAWRYAFQALVRRNPGFVDPVEIASSLSAWSRHIRILEGELSARSYIVGNEFSLADIPIGLSVNRWFATPIPERDDVPAVRNYFERLSARPAFMRHGRNGMP